jgi:hypothetical protein
MRSWGCICIILGRGLGRSSRLNAACFGDSQGWHLTGCTRLHGFSIACMLMLETKNVIVKSESKSALIFDTYMQHMPNVAISDASCDPGS